MRASTRRQGNRVNFKQIVLDNNEALADVRKNGLHALFLHLAKTQGDRLLIRKKDIALYLCSRPSDIKTIFLAGHRNHRKPLNDMLGDGLFSLPTSPEHREIRMAVQALYGNSRLQAMARVMEQHLPGILRDALAGRDIVDASWLFSMAKKCSIRLNAIVMFGEAVPPSIVEAISVMHHSMNTGLFTSAGVEAVLSDAAFQAAKQSIHQHISTAIANPVPDASGYFPLVAELAEVLTRAKVDYADMNGEVLSLLGSGVETAGATMFWALYELSRHQPHQDRLRHWITADAGPAWDFVLRRDTPIGEVILETLRLYPSGWAMFRQANTAIELEPGIDIPAGARICVSPFVTHRLAAHWEDPERFSPARFSDSGLSAQAYAQFRYFPFAGGVHRCVGERLALLEIGLVISEFLKQCAIEADGRRLHTLDRLCLEPSGTTTFKLTRPTSISPQPSPLAPSAPEGKAA